ncbi:MAG TPA: hypothetical protein PLW81_09150 [Thiobacillaceae bacterium]|nr:hypothetical protein [Thiobacillaceae bacterium]
MKPRLAGVFIIVVLSLIAACTGIQVNVNQADKADPSARVLRTRLEFVDQTYQAIPFSRIEQQPGNPSYPDPIEVNFHSVAGRLAGPDVERFFRIRLKRAHSWIEPGTQQDFAISLKAIENLISGRAASYFARPEDSEFKVEPTDTKFARLVLSAGNPFLYPYDERNAGFIAGKTGDQYALVYVDRPCRITGTIQANDGAFRHDLALDKPGLHWVRIQSTGAKSARVTRLDPAGAISVYVKAP